MVAQGQYWELLALTHQLYQAPNQKERQLGKTLPRTIVYPYCHLLVAGEPWPIMQGFPQRPESKERIWEQSEFGCLKMLDASSIFPDFFTKKLFLFGFFS